MVALWIVAINWNDCPHIDGNYPKGNYTTPPADVSFRYVNNAYVMMEPPARGDPTYLQAQRTSPLDEAGTTSNLFWPNGPETTGAQFGNSPQTDKDPMFVLSTTPGEKAITMNNPDLAGLGTTVIPPNLTYDFNGIAYDGGPVSIGPVQYEEVTP